MEHSTPFITCERCGRKIAKYTDACPYCEHQTPYGKSLTAPVAQPRAETVTAILMHCPRCGVSRDSDRTNCGACGTPLSPMPGFEKAWLAINGVTVAPTDAPVAPTSADVPRNVDDAMIDLIKARLTRITPGQWESDINRDGWLQVISRTMEGKLTNVCGLGDMEDTEAEDHANADFIGGAPDDIRFLLSLVDRLTAANAALQARVDALTRFNPANANDLRQMVTGEDFSHDGDSEIDEEFAPARPLRFKIGVSVEISNPRPELSRFKGQWGIVREFNFHHRDYKVKVGGEWFLPFDDCELSPFPPQDSPAPNGGETAADALPEPKRERIQGHIAREYVRPELAEIDAPAPPATLSKLTAGERKLMQSVEARSHTERPRTFYDFSTGERRIYNRLQMQSKFFESLRDKKFSHGLKLTDAGRAALAARESEAGK